MYYEPFYIFMVATVMELWKLHYLFYSIFQISIYPGLFSSQQLQMVRQMFFTMPVVFQSFKLNFWLIESK